MILETSDEIEVVGEAEDGREALRLTEKLQPKVVLIDLPMSSLRKSQDLMPQFDQKCLSASNPHLADYFLETALASISPC